MNTDLVISVENLSKVYRTGTIGGGTLRGDLQSMWARMRGKEDPNSPIYSKKCDRNGAFFALENINLQIHRGERIGIIGSNGAGKSTLLKIISRITAPTSGKVKIKGKIASMLEVGTGFHGELTGRENIYLNGSILGMTKAEVDKKIDTIIEFSECEKFIDTPVKRYSSGMYVKLAFAVAAHLDADIMIMDEVLAVGDMAFQDKCLGKMDEVSSNEGRTILYVSHNMSTIQRLCDRCIVLDEGKIIFDGDTNEAIELYLNNVVNPEVCKSYTDFERKRANLGRKVFIEHAQYYGHNSIQFTDRDKLKLLIRWNCREKVKNLCFRFEIWSVDKIAVASSMALGLGDYNAGETVEKVFSIDVSSLVPGNYRGYYAFFVMNEYGGRENLDWVPAMNFSRINTINDIVWNYRLWGRIRLEDAEVIDCEKNDINCEKKLKS